MSIAQDVKDMINEGDSPEDAVEIVAADNDIDTDEVEEAFIEAFGISPITYGNNVIEEQEREDANDSDGRLPDVTYMYEDIDGKTFTETQSRKPGKVGLFDNYLKNACWLDKATCPAEDLAKAVVDFWNDTLQSGDTPRKFVKLVEETDNAG